MRISKVRNVKTPTRGTPGSAGLDFYIPEDFPTTRVLGLTDILIPSGIKANIPKGHMLKFENKSGRAVKNKLLVGATVVDEDYQGEIHLHVFNMSTQDVILKPGEKLLQAILQKVEYPEIDVVDEDELFEYTSGRGEGGFGSTSLT